MKRFLLALVLSIASFIALAAPSPKQIEAALAARDYASAKTMISQVLAERPDSARAHLMKAFVLAASDKNKEAAKAELSIARTLDKNGDVVNSPLFGRTVGAIDAIAVAQALPPPRPAAVAPPVQAAPYVKPAPVVKQESSSTGLWIFLALLFAGGVGATVYFISRRPKEVVPSYSSNFTSSESVAPAPERAAPVYQSSAPRTQYVSAPAPIYRGGMDNSYGNSGTGMGTGAAVATGMVAGVAGAVVVDTMIENARLRERERYSSGSNNSWAPSPVPAPYASAPAEESRVDYESEAQSFSSSRAQADSWAPSPSPAPEPSSSSSSSSDSWGSSDSSSSSSDSSSSSSDSW